MNSLGVLNTFINIASSQRLMSNVGELCRDQLGLNKTWGRPDVCFPASEFLFLV